MIQYIEKKLEPALKIAIFTGELSGDLIATELVESLLQNRVCEIKAVAGDNLKKFDIELIEHINKLSIIGITEACSRIPFILKLFNKIVKILSSWEPDVIIFIDAPDFNLRLSKRLQHLRKKAVFIYYVSPQVWAWRYSRVYTIKKNIDHIFLLFKFEEKIYKHINISASYVGHHIYNRIKYYLSENTIHNKFQAETKDFVRKKRILLLPGSRYGEIRRLLPIYIKVAQILEKKHNVEFIIIKSSNINIKFIKKICGKKISNLIIEDNSNLYDILRGTDCALVASGTAVLELAYFCVPMIVCYKISIISYIIALFLIRNIKYISLVNIIADQKIIPEYIQFLAIKIIARDIEELLYDENKKNSMIKQLQLFNATIEQEIPSQKPAEIINSYFSK